MPMTIEFVAAIQHRCSSDQLPRLSYLLAAQIRNRTLALA
jgi:hypothetical protein